MSSQSNPQALTRRKTLLTVGGTIAAGFAGCLDLSSSDSASTPDPVALSGTKFDYHGGMEIGSHGGPNGQIFYRDNEPEPRHGSRNASEQRDALAWFHTLAHGLFPYHFDRLDRGWEATVIYVTDYSAVDWNTVERDGNEYMPSPTDAESFAEATALTYVVESDVLGGMGPALIPFSDPTDTEQFTDEFGGQTVTYDEISRGLVQNL